MSLRTITKITWFVIPIVAVSAVLSSCVGFSYGGKEHAAIDPNASHFGEPEIIAHIESGEIEESSGLAVSKCQNDVFWTHNDSGDGPFLYAINSAGDSLGVWKIPEAANIDWEDIATTKSADGSCVLYVADIGDNELRRDILTIYRLIEPSIMDRNSSRKDPISSEKAAMLRFRYPQGRNNAEALLVHPVSGEIYIVTKRKSGPAEVFKLTASFNSPDVQTAVKINDIALPASPVGIVTGGDISPDGKLLALCDYYAGYEFVLPDNSAGFDKIWFQKPIPFDLGPRLIGESVAFGADSDSVYATTERQNPPLIRVERKKIGSAQ